MSLTGYPARVVVPPSETQFPFFGGFRAVNAEEEGTGLVKLGEQDGEEGSVVPFEVVVGEDVRGDDADGVGGFGRDAGFVDPLGDYRFGEDVEEVDEKGGTGAVGRSV